MANEYFNASGYPGTRAQGASASMRSQLAAIGAAFDKLPSLSSNAGKLLAVNAGGTAIESISVISVSGSTTTLTGALVLGGGLSGVTTLAASGNATIGGTLGVTGLTTLGNLTVNGNTTIGDAAGDLLTITPSAVTWSNNPTHSGNHTFSGNVTIQGNTTIGNASGDALTVAPSAVTWSGNPTHGNNHTFSGNVTVAGNLTTTGDVTLGTAGVDGLTIGSANVTWSNNPTHAGDQTFSGNITLAGATTGVTGALTSASTARFSGAVYGTLGVRQGGAYGGAGPNTNNDDLVVENNGSAGITILTPNTASAALNFGDPESNLSARIAVNHATDTMSVVVGGSTVFTANTTSMTMASSTELIVADMTPTSAFSAGFRSIPTIGNTATATKAAVGKAYKNTGNLAINNSVFAADDVFAVYNNSASAITLNGTITTMRLAGTTTTGNRTIAPRGWATVFFVSATECVVSGAGVS